MHSGAKRFTRDGERGLIIRVTDGSTKHEMLATAQLEDSSLSNVEAVPLLEVASAAVAEPVPTPAEESALPPVPAFREFLEAKAAAWVDTDPVDESRLSTPAETPTEHSEDAKQDVSAPIEHTGKRRGRPPRHG